MRIKIDQGKIGTTRKIIICCFVSILSISSSFGFEGDDGTCGDRGTLLASFLTTWYIPDQWPPDEINPALSSAFGTTQLCRAFGTADWTPSCREHDRCYGLNLESRIQCDVNLGTGWVNACAEKWLYPDFPTVVFDLSQCS